MRPEQYSSTTVAPVSQMFAGLEPQEFRSNIESLWKAAAAITDTVTQQVESEKVTPLQGAAITAHVTGALFGYREFARELSPSDLALLSESASNGS